MQEVTDEQKLQPRNREGKRLLGRLGHRWKGDIKVDLSVVIYFDEDATLCRQSAHRWR
jgi:hypothetical protein